LYEDVLQTSLEIVYEIFFISQELQTLLLHVTLRIYPKHST